MTSPAQLTIPPQRIQRRRVRGWRLPAGARIVDRTTRFVELHADWLNGEGPAVYVVKGRRFDRNWVLTHLPELRGLDLACPCEPGTPCHADTLIARSNRPAREPQRHGTGPKPYVWPARGFAPLVDINPIGGVL